MAPDDQSTLLTSLTADTFDGADWPSPDRALLEYAEKLTRTPAAMVAADVSRLQAAGFDHRAIHDACAIVAYFAFVNRIADGLGVELEAPGGG